MSDVFSLLNIKSDLIKDFPLQASRIDEIQLNRVFNKNMRLLKQIEERMNSDRGINVSQRSIDEIVLKVKRCSNQGESSFESWSTRELRIVSYYLMKLRDDPKDYYFALSLLDRRWKSLFFNGLIFYVLNSWNYIEPEFREATCQLIIKKLKEYEDNNKRYILLKNHLNLFDKNGPLRLAALLTAKNIDLFNAPSIIGYKSSAFKQSYYSDVIINYIEKNNITKLDTISEIFSLHDIDRTKKLVCAYLVERENRRGDEIKRSILCRFINRTLGDVTLASTWAPFAGASNEDAARLKKAMRLVYMWFAQQIIEVFFEVCVQSKERKNFWLKYVKYLSGFKIIGSTATKRMLQSDSRIGSTFHRHFKETNSYTSQTSALVLFIKNKMLIEFSDTGALYVYNQGHKQVGLVTSVRTINSTNDLKIPSMNLLVEQDYYHTYHNEEGRFHHRGEWQDRLTLWMERKVLSAYNTSLSFFDTKDDELFKEKPLSKDFDIYESYSDDNPNTTIIKVERKEPEPDIVCDDEITYEKNVLCSISSKPFFYSRYRIVANPKGVYLNKIGTSAFARFRTLQKGESANGDIRIKSPMDTGWCEIVHFYLGTLFVIGYIKLEDGVIKFKNKLNQSDLKEIKL
ncbi:MAG: hypothetical protein IJ319_03925 [Bacteroidaceae bacterium]|nr:hypothetical protein [Bacteroidaceae bacterium]